MLLCCARVVVAGIAHDIFCPQDPEAIPFESRLKHIVEQLRDVMMAQYVGKQTNLYAMMKSLMTRAAFALFLGQCLGVCNAAASVDWPSAFPAHAAVASSLWGGPAT